MKKKIMVVAALLAVLMLCVGCNNASSSDEPSSETSTDNPSSETSTDNQSSGTSTTLEGKFVAEDGGYIVFTPAPEAKAIGWDGISNQYGADGFPIMIIVPYKVTGNTVTFDNKNVSVWTISGNTVVDSTGKVYTKQTTSNETQNETQNETPSESLTDILIGSKWYNNAGDYFYFATDDSEKSHFLASDHESGYNVDFHVVENLVYIYLSYRYGSGTATFEYSVTDNAKKLTCTEWPSHLNVWVAVNVGDVFVRSED